MQRNRRYLLIGLLLMVGLLVAACGIDKDLTEADKKSDNLLKVSIPLRDINTEMSIQEAITGQLSLSQINVFVSNQADSSEEYLISQDISNQSDEVNLSFNQVTAGATYEVRVEVIDIDGYLVYKEESPVPVTIKADTINSVVVDLLLTKAKSLVVNMTNIPSNATSGEVILKPTDKNLTAAIDLATGVAEFSEIPAQIYALEIIFYNGAVWEKNISVEAWPGRFNSTDPIDVQAGETGVKIGVTWPNLAAPTNLSASEVTSGVELSWDSVSGVDGYLLYRDTTETGDNKVPITDSLITNTSYIDTTVEAGVAYYYWVEAYAGDVVSEFSNMAIINDTNSVVVMEDVLINPSTEKWHSIQLVANDNGKYISFYDRVSADKRDIYFYRNETGSWDGGKISSIEAVSEVPGGLDSWSDGTKTYINLNVGLKDSFGSNTQTLYSSTDGGITFESKGTTNDIGAAEACIDQVTGKYHYVFHRHDGYWDLNYGNYDNSTETMSAINYDFLSVTDYGYNSGIFAENNKIFVVDKTHVPDEAIKVYYSEDDGVNWEVTRIGDLPRDSYGGTSIIGDVSNENIVYISFTDDYTADKIYLYQGDYSSTTPVWTKLKTIDTVGLHSRIAMTDSGKLVLVYLDNDANYKYIVSTDSGTSWSAPEIIGTGYIGDQLNAEGKWRPDMDCYGETIMFSWLEGDADGDGGYDVMYFEKDLSGF